MSTPFDAVSSRCRPVRLWNGSSSASQRRQATTRCWKGSRGEAGSGKREGGKAKREDGIGKLCTRIQSRSLFPLPASLFPLLLVPALLFAQQTEPTTPSHPEVVNLTFKGVKSVKVSELQQSVYTTASYCNSFILKPFCLISHAKYFFTKKYLDHSELQRDPLRIRVFYWKRGYREAEVDTVVVKRGANKVGVTFFIKEGPPTLVSSLVVDQPTPTLLSQREIDRRVVLSKNAPLNLIRVDSSRFFLQTRMFDKGYADAEVDTTIVIGQVESRFTDYNFFGSARRLDVQGVVGNLFAKTLSGRGIFQNATVAQTSALARYFVPTYNASIDLTQPWFGSPHNSLGVSLFTHRRSVPGIYVDRGSGTSLTFTRELAERAPASVNYRFEISKVDAGDVYFCINFGVCDQPTLESLRGNQKLSPITINAVMDRTNDPFEPNTGYRANTSVEHASTFTASDFRYNRATADGAAFYQVRKRGALGAHTRVGWVRSLGSTAQAVGISASLGDGVLHPRKRFYAGGSHSVRGFGENQLGPRVLTIPIGVLQSHDSANAACLTGTDVTTCNPNAANLKDRDFEPRPLGGNFVMEGSIEARFPIWGQLSGAGFIDAGVVSQKTSPDLPRRKGAVTPGFGARYQSPVGPIRADIGLSPGGSELLPVITESIVNGQKTLVRLQQRRTYAPTSGGGFLNRLVLHLSIGEAF